MRKHKPPWLKRIRLAVTGVVMAITMAVAPAAMADLNGVDISGYQSFDIPFAISADFIIVKATQGLYGNNNNYATQLANADRTGKETSVYHFANGGNATAEADTFVNAVSGRVGRSILALDWEQCLAYGRYGCATANPNWGNPAWIQTWVPECTIARRSGPSSTSSGPLSGRSTPGCDSGACSGWRSTPTRPRPATRALRGTVECPARA